MSNLPPEETDPGIPPESVLPAHMPDLGPLMPLLRDTRVTEIFVNDSRRIFVEREGRVLAAGLQFASADTLENVILSILSFAGERPEVIADPRGIARDLSLPDGSRVHLVLPPTALHGPALTIRKYPQTYSLKQLIGTTLTPQAAEFLHFAVRARFNILLSGGTGSGKTTLMNALIGQIPFDERLVAIEDTPELKLQQPNAVVLRTQTAAHLGEILNARDLVTHALRMRPDRILIGELRRAEALDFILALNTGHAGSMTTLHANSPRDALSRLETLAMLGGHEIPHQALRKQVGASLDLVVQIQRTREGQRRVSQITEVTGLEGDNITLQDIYLSTETASATDPLRPVRRLQPTGLVPVRLDRLLAAGMTSPTDYFAK